MNRAIFSSKLAGLAVLASGVLLWSFVRPSQGTADEADDEQTKGDKTHEDEEGNDPVYRDIHLLWDTSKASTGTFGKDRPNSSLQKGSPVPSADEIVSNPRNGGAFDDQQTQTVQNHQRDLEFLASMTFANGGMRAPSCPCCV